jgi:hypothetical protein
MRPTPLQVRRRALDIWSAPCTFQERKGMSDAIPNPPVPGSPPPKSTGCVRALVIVALALIAAGTVVALRFGESAKQAFGKVTGGFMTSHTTLKADEILLEMGRTHGDVLEVASPLKTVETFSRGDVRFAAWGWVYLGTTISEIKVPATYRFHIKLSEMKQSRLDDSVLIVTAPAIHPTLPVAFDTMAMEKKADGTWLRFDAEQQLAELESSVTPALALRAEGHVKTVRENARRDIEEFVQKWIVDSQPNYRAKIKAVKVIFPGEDARVHENGTAVP